MGPVLTWHKSTISEYETPFPNKVLKITVITENDQRIYNKGEIC